MLRCEICKVNIENPRKFCPLCQCELVGHPDGEQETFPELPTVYSQYRLFFRILIFFSIVGGGSALLMNIFWLRNSLWSIIVLASIFYTWSTLITAVRRRSRISKKLLYQVIVLSILLYAIDRGNGYVGWSVNYAIPAVHVSALISMAVIAIVQRPLFSEYLIHLIVTAFLGIAPLIIVLVGWADVLWPSLSCTAASIVALIAIIVFGTHEAKNELERRFHI